MLVPAVQACIDAYIMLPSGASVMVAVSGGPDSMALLSVLYHLRHQYALTLMVVHVNHQLRGEEAERDALFVENQASQLGLPFYQTRVDVKALQRAAGLSPQHAARQLRYAAFHALQQARGATHIALGHTADDQAETLLVRLLRGGGPAGLSGIPAIRSPFIRPLITTSRDDIIRYLKTTSIPWVVDSSNSQRAYLRNRLRLDLLPVLKQYNPRIVNRLNELAEMVGAENEILKEQTRRLSEHVVHWRSGGRAIVQCVPYRAAPLALQRRLLRQLIDTLLPFPDVVGFRHVEALRQFVLTGTPGKRLTLPAGIIGESYSDTVFIWHRHSASVPSGSWMLPVPGEIDLPEFQIRLYADVVTSDVRVREASPNSAYLDKKRIQAPLSVRFPQPGDRFQPLGAPGRKKVKDFFIDHKVPRAERPYVPLVVSGQEIVWVVGYRIADACKVRPETRWILRLRCDVNHGKQA